jgi:hypothetical protein
MSTVNLTVGGYERDDANVRFLEVARRAHVERTDPVTELRHGDE